ncbi:MAG: hypothetical protein ACM3KM_02175 [Acidobacteriaceae bacterium]
MIETMIVCGTLLLAAIAYRRYRRSNELFVDPARFVSKEPGCVR